MIGNSKLRAFQLLIFAAIALTFTPLQCAAQDADKPVDRIYEHPQIDVQKALDSLDAFATERLPTLDGFVKANAATLDHFENPHYQLHIDVNSQGVSQTLVSVTAKITAWYAGEDAVHSQYVVIPSNGRLENDFLDRLSIYMEKGGKAGLRPASTPGSTPSAGATGPSADPPASAGDPADPPPVTSSDPAVLASNIAALRAERQSVEAKERKTQQQIDELSTISKNQKYLATVAVVRSAQTPVFTDSDETSKVLFHADPDDEFEIIDGRSGFVHVKLEGAVTGWIRVAQLLRPGESDEADSSASANFNTSNEQIKTFDGDWAPLKGKLTLFVFAEPVRKLPEGTLGQSQLEFAKQVFVDGYREANHTEQPAEGVVVVFLGEKGGVAAAALADIRRWRDGLLTDKAFLDKCSFDPPDSFRDSIPGPGRNRPVTGADAKN